MRNIYGSNVLVTGASSGIGREISILFASEGYNVFATSRHIEEKEEVLGKGRIISYRADVTDPGSLLKLREKMESLSIIIHAAGFGIAGSAEDMEIDLARKQLDVNYFGPMTVNNIFLPMLRENERSLIIFISSIAGRVPIPFQSQRTVLLEPGDTKTDFTARRKTYIPEGSIYKEDAIKAIRKMEKDEENGKSPLTVAKAALKIAGRKNPPVRKPIGIEYSALMLLLRILPQNLVEKILMRLY